MLAFRRFAGQQEEIVGRNPARPEVDLCIEGDEGNGKIAGIAGDAGFAGAEHGVIACEAADGGATAAGRTLVAGGERLRDPEKSARRSLHPGSADGRPFWKL